MRPTASSFPESSVNEFRPCSFGAYPEKREPEENSRARAQVVYAGRGTAVWRIVSCVILQRFKRAAAIAPAPRGKALCAGG
jgi:hypothetical protein